VMMSLYIQIIILAWAIPPQTTQMPNDDLDVLLVHGRDDELVRFFIEFFDSLGLIARNAQRLASAGHPQAGKVNHYLDHARMILVLATFDDQFQEPTAARPNVYLELQTSLLRRAADTIVLREVRGGKEVDIGSNLNGQIIELKFSRDAIHKILPAVLGELRQRKMVSPISSSDHAFGAGQILNSFLDEMDIIWEKEFDEAWKEIFQTSYDHESDFATTLDLFFQDYQAVFSALIRDKKRGDELKSVVDQTLFHAWTLAARAWETVADAKRSQANTARSRLRNHNDSPFRDAVRLVADAKKERNPREQIAIFRRAIAALNKIITRKVRR